MYIIMNTAGIMLYACSCTCTHDIQEDAAGILYANIQCLFPNNYGEYVLGDSIESLVTEIQSVNDPLSVLKRKVFGSNSSVPLTLQVSAWRTGTANGMCGLEHVEL